MITRIDTRMITIKETLHTIIMIEFIFASREKKYKTTTNEYIMHARAT